MDGPRVDITGTFDVLAAFPEEGDPDCFEWVRVGDTIDPDRAVDRIWRKAESREAAEAMEAELERQLDEIGHVYA